MLGGGRLSFASPSRVTTEAAYGGALWTLWVKLRGALGETGDGEGVAAVTPFNLCWQFQFPAEKDISHSCLKKNVNLAVLFIKLVPVTTVGPMAGSPCQQPHPDLFIFTVVIKTNLDTQVSVRFTNDLVNCSVINTPKNLVLSDA